MSKESRKLEIEAKLLIESKADLRNLASLSRLGPYSLRPRKTERLHSVYLDTRDFWLLRHGFALRLRRRSRRWELTAKWAGQRQGAVHIRMEETVILRGAPSFPFDIPPGAVKVRLRPIIGRRALRPILVTDIQRQCLDIFSPGTRDKGRPTAELALDRVCLKHPDETRSRQIYREVEIELVGGNRHDLTVLVGAIRRHAAFPPSLQSKFSRGMELLYPDANLNLEPDTRD